MRKACYKRIAMAELNGSAYERVEGQSLIIIEDITERQLKYLKLEYLPIPRVNAKIPNSDEYSLELTKKTTGTVSYAQTTQTTPGIQSYHSMLWDDHRRKCRSS